MLHVSSSTNSHPVRTVNENATQQGVLQGGNRTVTNVPSSLVSKRPKLSLNLDSIHREVSIGRGLAGEVFKDKENPGFVVKRYNASNAHDAREECALFNRFYGEGSAVIFVQNGRAHLRMLEVPGTPLTRISEFPADSEKLFLDMIVDMGEHKIIHGDLHMGNILYDEKANRFWPIDFSNSYNNYYSLDNKSKAFANEITEKDFSSILQHLRLNAAKK